MSSKKPFVNLLLYRFCDNRATRHFVLYMPLVPTVDVIFRDESVQLPEETRHIHSPKVVC